MEGHKEIPAAMRRWLSLASELSVKYASKYLNLHVSSTLESMMPCMSLLGRVLL